MSILFRMPISRYRFQIMCRLSRPILLRLAATMRGTEPTCPPECHSTEWSTDWGCSLASNLLWVVTTSGWIASNDLFDCCVACWSTIKADFVTRTHFEWLQSQGKVQPTSLLQQWFNSVLGASLWASFSSQFFKKKEARMLFRTDDDRQRVEETSCSDTRCWRWRPSVRKHKQHLVLKNTKWKS